MERPRARSCIAAGAIAGAIAAAAGGTFEVPRDLTADLDPVAAIVIGAPADTTARPTVEEPQVPQEPTPKPSKAPLPAASAEPSATPQHHHGNDADPSSDPHNMGDPAHDQDVASHAPMETDGHVAGPSSSPAPGDVHGHGAGPSIMPDASDDDGTAPGEHDEGMASHEPVAGHDDPTGGHDDPTGGHDEAAGGHGDEEPPGERPRGVVFGGFFAINAIALAGAAILRRRDTAAAALKTRRTPAISTRKDAPR